MGRGQPETIQDKLRRLRYSLLSAGGHKRAAQSPGVPFQQKPVRQSIKLTIHSKRWYCYIKSLRIQSIQ